MLDRFPLSLAAFGLVAGCASPEERRRADLMDEIERNVVLPPGAQPLRTYARTYKFVAPERVEAFYFTPDDRLDGDFCAGTKEGGRTNGQVLLACKPPWGLGAGQRRWLDDDVHLPAVSDGGCYYISINYDLSDGGRPEAYCNGEA